MKSNASSRAARAIVLAGGSLLLVLAVILAGFSLGRRTAAVRPTAETAPGPTLPAPVRTPAIGGDRPPAAPEPASQPVRNPTQTVRPGTPAPPQASGQPQSPVFLANAGDTAALTAQVYEFLQERQAAAGPETAQLGRQLLHADQPLLRASGAMLLIESGAFTDDALRAVAADPDPSVALNTLGWLRDMGHGEQAGQMLDLIGGLAGDTDRLVDLLAADGMLPTGQRLVLDLLSSRLTAESGSQLYAEIASNDTMEHSVRLKGVLLLRGTAEFEDYREQVNRLTTDATAPEWGQALNRLSEQLEGPVEVHTAPPAIGGDDIEERLARPYPTMLADLALHLEYVLASEDRLVERGTSEALEEHLSQFRGQPLSPEEWVSLKRLEALKARIAAEER